MLQRLEPITDDHLRFIAGLDYGQDSDRHFFALRSVIFEQSSQFREEQSWFPYEVVELGAHQLHSSHEREFVICTLLVIHAVKSGFDKTTDLAEKFSSRAAEYDLLPAALREIILSSYAAVGC